MCQFSVRFLGHTCSLIFFSWWDILLSYAEKKRITRMMLPQNKNQIYCSTKQFSSETGKTCWNFHLELYLECVITLYIRLFIIWPRNKIFYWNIILLISFTQINCNLSCFFEQSFGQFSKVFLRLNVTCKEIEPKIDWSILL